jgi:hypothetical protein
MAEFRFGPKHGLVFPTSVTGTPRCLEVVPVWVGDRIVRAAARASADVITIAVSRWKVLTAKCGVNAACSRAVVA